MEFTVMRESVRMEHRYAITGVEPIQDGKLMPDSVSVSTVDGKLSGGVVVGCRNIRKDGTLGASREVSYYRWHAYPAWLLPILDHHALTWERRMAPGA